MTIGIYSITHRESGKRYIGKSVNIEHRLWSHKRLLTNSSRDVKQTNRYLYSAVQKYGWGAFDLNILEPLAERNSALLAERELYWMDYFNTTDPAHGYNLRRDSSGGMEVHEDTRFLLSMINTGSLNGNFGNKWSDDQKRHMAEDRKRRSDRYGDEWRKRIAVRSRELMADPDMRNRIAERVSITKRLTHDFVQYTREGVFVRRWFSVDEILTENPEYKWQNIYSVCNGYKPTYMGFMWRKVGASESHAEHLEPMVRKARSAEANKKISQALRGRKYSDVTLERMRLGAQNRHLRKVKIRAFDAELERLEL